MLRLRTMLTALCAGLLLSGSPALAREVIPSNTVVQVRLLHDLSSRDAQVGDRVRTLVTEEDASGFPAGTALVGRVTQVQRATRDRPGVIDIRFGTAELPGRWVPVSGTLYSLHEKDVRRTASGRLEAQGRRHDPMKFIGYGALGGVVLGRILGTSTLEGALLGAAAGYLYGQSRRDKSQFRDVALERGETFGVRLDRQVVLQTSDFARVPARAR
jgi:hypothetical protein